MSTQCPLGSRQIERPTATAAPATKSPRTLQQRGGGRVGFPPLPLAGRQLYAVDLVVLGVAAAGPIQIAPKLRGVFPVRWRVFAPPLAIRPHQVVAAGLHFQK